MSEGVFTRHVLSEHGGLVLLKLSQWLCHREDVVPPHIIEILKPLQDHVPVNDAVLDECMKKNGDLGMFLASGSVSLVFESKKNPNMVIKVQRKHTQNKRDISFWRSVFGVLHTTYFMSQVTSNMSMTLLNSINTMNILSENEKQNVGLIQKLDTYFRSEMEKALFIGWDFTTIDIHGFLDILERQMYFSNELHNYRCMKQCLKDLDFVLVPDEVHLTHFNTLTMTKINGLTYKEVEKKYPEYCVDMRQKMLIAYFWMIYSKVIHTDLHDGNYLYVLDPHDDRKNKVAILDYGMCTLPCDSLYWDLWKAFSHRNTTLLYTLISGMIVTPMSEKRIHKIDLYRSTKTLSFSVWLDDILIQIRKLGLVICAESSNVLIGFILLGRNRILNSNNEYVEIDIFKSSIDMMSRSTNEKVACLGKEIANDLDILRQKQ